MRFSTVLLALNLGSAALAFPAVFKRQDDPTSASIGEPIASALPVPSSLPTDLSTDDEDDAEATATVVAVESSAAPSGSALPVVPEEEETDFSAYPCPEGYLLTYAETQQTFPVSFAAMEEAGLVGQWSSGPQNDSDDDDSDDDETDEVGATRTRSSGEIEGIEEELVNVTSTEGFYQAESNLTAPITSGETTIANWSYVYQVYANDTAGEEASTVKLFANACGNEQGMTQMLLEDVFANVLANVESTIDEEDSTDASASAAVSSATVVVDVPVVTATEEETETATATETDSETATQTESATITEEETATQTATETEVSVSQTVSVDETTETAVSVSVSVETETAVETATEVSVNEVTETATATATEEPEVAQVTSQVVVPSVVSSA